jgi:hypothetical protein
MSTQLALRFDEVPVTCPAFELSRVVHHTTGHRLHNETVKALLNR